MTKYTFVAKIENVGPIFQDPPSLRVQFWIVLIRIKGWINYQFAQNFEVLLGNIGLYLLEPHQ